MQVRVVGKNNLVITPAMQEAAEKQITRLKKSTLIPESAEITAAVTAKGRQQRVEITIPIREHGILRAEVTDMDYYRAVSKAVNKINDQLRRYKTRYENRHRNGIRTADAAMADTEHKKPDDLVRTKRIYAEKLSVDEAIEQMNLSGHTFFAYIDEETDKPAVVYAREETGTYGLLEIEWLEE